MTARKASKKQRLMFNREAGKPKRQRLKRWECPVGGAHYWDLDRVDSTTGKTVMGTCRKCGLQRRFPKNLKEE